MYKVMPQQKMQHCIPSFLWRARHCVSSAVRIIVIILEAKLMLHGVSACAKPKTMHPHTLTT